MPADLPDNNLQLPGKTSEVLHAFDSAHTASQLNAIQPGGPSHSPEPAWQKSASKLAEWTLKTLVNRNDLFGAYPRKGKPGEMIHESKSPVTKLLLEDHFRGKNLIGLHALSVDETCRWIVVDIDRHTEDVDRQKNEEAAMTWFDRATSLGCHCFLEDSDGRGSFKMWVLFEAPLSAQLASNFAHWLSRDWKQLGLKSKPEMFPKQIKLTGKKSGNWVRLPGRHHTRLHWSQVWDRGRWLSGTEATEVITSCLGGPPPVIPGDGIGDAKPKNGVEMPKSDVSPSSRKVGEIPTDLVRQALAVLPSHYCEDYKKWTEVGMALRSQGDVGLELWENWSRASDKFKSGECQQKWESFDTSGKLSLRHLFAWADKHGKSVPTNLEGDGDDDNDLREETIAKPEIDAGDGDPVPILWRGKSLDRITRTVFKGIARRQKPEVFQHGEVLVRLRTRMHDGAKVIEPMSETAVRAWLDQVATWWVQGREGLTSTLPPNFIVKHFMHLPGWNSAYVPVLEAVTEVPIFTRDGSLVVTPGYHQASGIFYHPPAGLVIPSVPESPTSSDVIEAKRLLINELLGDFPFKDDGGASQAHALGGILHPFAREMFIGSVPIHAIDASKPGSGKGLLTDVIVSLATGRAAETTPYPGNDEEMRKAVTAALMEGPAYISLDNVSKPIESAILANLLTAPQWSDRILGASKKVHLTVRALILANGNNLQMSTEMTRRTVLIRLEPNVERPWDRPASAFQHSPLLEWALAERGRLVWAALMLIQNWIAGGKKPGKQTLGRFESWAQVIGGILNAAGVAGFLANNEDLYAWADEGTDEFRVFVLRWWDLAGKNVVGVRDLFPMVRDQKLLPSKLNFDEEEEVLKKKFGKILSKEAGAVYCGMKIKLEGKKSRDGTKAYALEQIDTTELPPAPPSTPDCEPITGAMPRITEAMPRMMTQADIDELLGDNPDLPPPPIANSIEWYGDASSEDETATRDEQDLDA